MHQYRDAGPGQRQGGKQEPGRAAGAAGAIGRPVQIHAHRPRQPRMRSGGLHQAGDFLGILPPETQQHQEGADLMRIGLAPEHHAERGLGLGAGQGAGPAGTPPQRGDEHGKLGFQGLGHTAVYRVQRPAARPRRLRRRRGPADWVLFRIKK